MKSINWNTEKSVALKSTRGICFEEVVFFIERGDIVDDYLHPDQKAYPAQKIMVINIANCAYLIPYVEDDEELFLKTIIPSRAGRQHNDILEKRYEDKIDKRRKSNTRQFREK